MIEEASKKQLAVTHATPTMHKVVELTVRPSEMEKPDELVLSRTYATLQPGKVVTCTVHQTSPDQLWVHTAPSVRGRIFALDVSDKADEIEKMEELFVPGTVLQAQVVHVNPEKRTVDLNRRVRVVILLCVVLV